jgi:glutaconate CoA-transferase subunit B
MSINSDYSVKDVQDNCGLELLKASKITETQPPTEDELKILRDEVDPHRYVIGR